MARWGSSSDSDGRPGSEETSKEYDIKYRAGGKYDGTDRRDVDVQNYLELEGMQNGVSAASSADIRSLRRAIKRIQEWEDAKFIVPKENTYAAIEQLIERGGSIDIGFSAERYPAIDGRIQRKADRPDLFEDINVQNNIAAWRNEELRHVRKDEKFTDDEKNNFREMSNAIGYALRSDKGWLPRVLKPSLNAEILKVPGEGAAAIHQFLYEQQASKGLLGNLGAFVRDLFNQPRKQWNLPPIEETPFSAENLAKPAPIDELCQCTPEQLQARNLELAKEKALAAKAERPDIASKLNLEQRRQVIEDVRTIMEWLRNIEFSDKSVQEMIDAGNAGETAEERANIKTTLDAYKAIIAMAEDDQQILSNPAIRAAQEAVQILEHMEHSIELLAKLDGPNNLTQAMQISADVTKEPEKKDESKGQQTIKSLMQKINAGIEQAFSAVEQQQQDMEAAQDAAQEAQMELATHNQTTNNKKKKRSSGKRTGKGPLTGAKALTMDDYAKGEGAFLNRNENQVSVPRAPKPVKEEKIKSFTPEADALIKEMGKALVKNHGSGRNMMAAQGISVASTDKIVPDDKPFVLQQAQKKERDQQNGKQI